MASSSKLKMSFEGKEDRISSLPDSIITLILSRLPTRCAVATSALSSRWKNLWTTIDNFEFDDVTLRLLTECKDYAEGFPRFVNAVIQKCDAINIHTFCLRYHGIENSVFLHDCILFAISRNVHELELCVLDGRHLKFPNEFFTCKSLEKLKIEIDYLFKVPLSNDTFPNLKSLHIQFKYPDSNLCRKLLSNCPKLEDLVIHAGAYYWEHLQRKGYGQKITVQYLLDNLLLSPEHRFPNLARLEITISDFILRFMLPVFLRASPDLSVLILRMEHAEKSDGNFSRSFNSEWSQMVSDEVPTCLLKHLKEIRIKSYQDVFLERKMIKYLLQYSEILEKMSIHLVKPGTKEQVSQWILKVPRASKKCQLKVV
ncbi:hypothetical protein KSS87_008870 [Heliosperma pusillum]|nr:hypothetical protein KSS87_008870 [Heliosperma pusillum]